jgi:hypothetical protein
VIIEPADKLAPTTAIIRHSDGTQSTLEFSN